MESPHVLLADKALQY